MAVTHNEDTRTAIAESVLATIDADSLPGNLIFKEGTTIIATLVLTYPAGVVSAGTLTFSPINPDTSAIAGTIDNYVITDNSNNEVLYGTVTVIGGGGDITLTSVTIETDDTVGLTELYYVAPS